MKALTLIIFLAAGSILSADVVTSTTCTVGGLNYSSGPTVTDPHNCSLQSVVQQPFGSAAIATATVGAGFSLAGNSNNYSSLSVIQNASASPGFDNIGNLIGADAGSRASINETLVTAGDVRPGFVQIIASANINYYFLRDSSADQILSLGNIYVDCENLLPFGGYCIFFPNGDHNLGGSSQLPSGTEYPFILGQSFNLNYSGDTGANTIDGGGAANSSMQFQFRFFEADGVTLVAVEATPEPGTLALLGLALGVLSIGTSKFRRYFPSRHRFFKSEQ